MRKALMLICVAVLAAGCGNKEQAGEQGKKQLVVGFSQIGAESAWRTAERRLSCFMQL